jgi:hypothetical protein
LDEQVGAGMWIALGIKQLIIKTLGIVTIKSHLMLLLGRFCSRNSLG